VLRVSYDEDWDFLWALVPGEVINGHLADETVDDETPDFSHPCARATIAAGTVTLNAWDPGMFSGGPTQAVLDEIASRGVHLADVPRIGEEGDELIVSFVTPRPDDAAREALVAWARKPRTTACGSTTELSS